ncbi:MAG: 4'-phosphopantetheinyl transferase superfamily protein [Zavarzinella sp.]
MAEHSSSVLLCSIANPQTSFSAQPVHLYLVPLDQPAPIAEANLSDIEQNRAARFKREISRTQFVTTRLAVRYLLGQYLHTPPREVQFHYLESGKPYLPGAPLHFNVSHSGAWAVVAISRYQVGVDIEQIRPFPEASTTVERFFGTVDAARYRTIAEPDQQNAFFEAWTRKEAVLKALGRGIMSLEHCSVSFGPGTTPQVLGIDGEEIPCDLWRLFAWQPHPEYQGAVAWIENPAQR